MGYLAAQTQRITIASELPIYSRTPSLLAMTAAGTLPTDGRAMLGLGASGPQVIEAFMASLCAPWPVPGKLLNLSASLTAKKFSTWVTTIKFPYRRIGVPV